MKRLHKRVLMAGCVVAALAGGTAMAGEPATGKDYAADHGFDRLDVNHDGVLSRSEVTADADIRTHFAQYDLDGDQRLNRSEFAFAVAQHQPPCATGGPTMDCSRELAKALAAPKAKVGQ